MKTTSEGSRGHHAAADPERLSGGPSRLHHGATWFAVWAPACQLLETSSTAT
jgi:hypothetical protein